MVKAIVLGAAGRMGRRLVACASNCPQVSVVGGIEQPGSSAVGKDLGEIAGIGKTGAAIGDSLAEVIEQADVCVDFTHHSSTVSFLPVVVEHKKALVICTTGLDDKELRQIQDAAGKIPVLLSPNMSVGVNLLFDLVGEVSSKLGEEYNIEIVEAHHNRKKDSPSGTAAKLADIAAEARGRNMARDGVYGRKGMVGERKPTEIGVHAVRAGDIVGEHTVVFAGPGERIELVHRAHSRDTFANGALKAAVFLAGKPPGMYSMKDVLSK
jgi:4-hydroxy-tetrahydrodipicolinate reductase